MNSKLGTFVSTALMLGGVMLWSVSVLADEIEPAPQADLPQQETRVLAADAHREAVDLAVLRMRESARIDLDIELHVRTSVQVSGD